MKTNQIKNKAVHTAVHTAQLSNSNYYDGEAHHRSPSSPVE